MPFPWTKNRVTPISQIVADLQSPKRRVSRVVETGFSSSLIDFFVKNRTRFRKPKSKKPVPPETPSTSAFTVVLAESRRIKSPSLVTENVYGDNGVASSGPEIIRVGEFGDGSASKTVLDVFLKMFAVVVLIASLKMLTVGITVSAFALLFLENAGKRVVSYPNANVVGMIKFFTQRICSCVWFQKPRLKIKKDLEGQVVSELIVRTECRSYCLPLDEIEVVGNKSEVGVCSEGTCFAAPKLDSFNGNNKRGRLDMQEDSNGKIVDSYEISPSKIKSSHRVKFKSKMKKLVLKMLTGYRKERKGMRGKENEAKLSSESPSTIKEDKSPSFETEEEQKGNENRSSLLVEIKLEYVRENKVDHEVTFSQECSWPRVEGVALDSEKKRRNGVGDLGYPFLFVIALVGLIMGRFPALILALTWCLLLKIVTTR